MFSPAGKTITGKKVGEDQLLYGTSQVVAKACRVLAALVIVKVLGPRVYGLWVLCLIVMTYGRFLGAGLESAMTKEISYQRGRPQEKNRREQKISLIRNVVFSDFIIISIVILSASGFVFLMNVGSRSSGITPFLPMLGLSVGLRMMYAYIHSYFFANNWVKSVTFLEIFSSVLINLLAVLFVLRWNISGLLSAYCLGYALTIVYGVFKYKIYPRLQLSWSHTVRLLRIGFPFKLSLWFFLLYMTIDRFIIGMFFPKEYLGFYNVGAFVRDLMLMMVVSFVDVLFVNMSELYGKTKDVDIVKNYVLSHLRKIVLIIVPCLFISYYAAPIAIQKLYPEFAPGIVPAQIQIFTLLPVGLLYANNMYFVAIHQQKKACLLAGVAFVLNATCVTLLIPFRSISVVAMGVLIVSIIVSLGMVALFLLCTQKRANVSYKGLAVERG